MAHLNIKNNNPETFSDSEIIYVNCMQPSDELLDYLKNGGTPPWEK